MAKFSDRINSAAKESSVILANDYNNKTPKLEEKTIRNIKKLIVIKFLSIFFNIINEGY